MILSLLLFYFTADIVLCSNRQSIIKDIKNGMVKLTAGSYISTPQFLKDAVGQIPSLTKQERADTICESCESVIDTVINYRKEGATDEEIQALLEKICVLSSDWGTIGCQGYMEIGLETYLYIMDNKKDLTAARVCAIYFQDYGCEDPDAKKWEIPLPPPSTSKISNIKIEESDPLKILQLTDIHYDPLYVPGSNSKCDVPLCCQTGIPSDPQNAAGYWGDYNVCDMPIHSVENLLSRVKEKHLKGLDFIYYTGDIVSHKSWATTKEDNTKRFKELFAWFTEAFGDKVVYPILGNHEPHPTNFYTPENVTNVYSSTKWIFNLAAEEWARWLPAETAETILRGGYYTVSPKPGFRIIALNSNVCFTSNSWLYYEDEDPYKQLAWLVEVLAEAEKNKEQVHILSHIPAGEISCHKQWSNQFRKIVNRFASTISAQFNGHTHQDELKVFYDPDDNNTVINVAFNGASFTTFVANNPNYRIYEVDPSNMRVDNYHQYIFNLTEANQNQSAPPRWYKLYSFKEAYDLTDLSNNSFHELLQKMSGDLDIVYQYFRFYVRDSDKLVKQGCDEKCLKQLLCYITAVETTMSIGC